MIQIKLTQIEKENWYKYHKLGGSRLTNRCPVNTINFSHTELTKHILSKCVLAIGLRKFGENVLTDNVIKLINDIDKEIKSQKHWKNPINIITEAIPNEDKNRRIDVVELANNWRYEIETDKNENKDKRGGVVKTIYI